MSETDSTADSATFEVRVHDGDHTGAPTLIYLPGLHGNWTLIGNFRRALNRRFRFVETCYPPTVEWTLDNFAEAFESAMLTRGIQSGWILAESFGSQIAWPILGRNRFKVNGLILAGGFVRHPMNRLVRMAETIAGQISLKAIIGILFGYAKISRFRFRNSPETLLAIDEFIARLNEKERQAALHRLHLVAGNSPLEIARNVTVPVFGVTGFFDPVVPWIFVRPWLRRYCQALKCYQVIGWADHNVLGTAPNRAAELIVEWVHAVEGATAG